MRAERNQVKYRGSDSSGNEVHEIEVNGARPDFFSANFKASTCDSVTVMQVESKDIRVVVTSAKHIVYELTST